MKNFNPRPSQLDPSIKTMIGLPNFPAYPSGHSTFSAAAATTLGAIFPQGAASFNAMADEAGVSRLYGGIPLSQRHPRREGPMGPGSGRGC
jgi:membrane-associated phospholipid phosphatase